MLEDPQLLYASRPRPVRAAGDIPLSLGRRLVPSASMIFARQRLSVFNLRAVVRHSLGSNDVYESFAHRSKHSAGQITELGTRLNFGLCRRVRERAAKCLGL